MAPLSYVSLQKLKLLEVSALGVHQLAAGVPVTDPRDRDLVVKLLAAGSPTLPCDDWEKMLRSGPPENRRRIAEMVESALTVRDAA